MAPRRRPKLELRFDTEGNDRVVLARSDGIDAASVRLRVSNGRGKDTADDVVVMVTEVRRLEELATPIGLPLTWSGSSPPLTVASVHPGSERHIDLLHIDLPTTDEIDVTAQLDLTPKPAGNRDVLYPGEYESPWRFVQGTRM